jgi:hypothetical protein
MVPAYKEIEAYEPIETVYTFTEWEKIYKANKLPRKAVKGFKEVITAVRTDRSLADGIKQKLSGLSMVACGVAAPILLEGDATASLLFIPMGLYLVFTRQKVMDF